VIAARHPRVQPRRVLSSALSSVLSLCRRGSGPPGEYPRWLRGRQSACFSFCPFNSEPAGMILRACSGWGVLRRRCVCVCVCVFVCCVVCWLFCAFCVFGLFVVGVFVVVLFCVLLCVMFVFFVFLSFCFMVLCVCRLCLFLYLVCCFVFLLCFVLCLACCVLCVFVFVLFFHVSV